MLCKMLEGDYVIFFGRIEVFLRRSSWLFKLNYIDVYRWFILGVLGDGVCFGFGVKSTMIWLCAKRLKR